MKPKSAGCLIFLIDNDSGEPLFFLVKPNASQAAYGIPKGEIELNEAPIFAAMRETTEETSLEFKVIAPLGKVKYKSRKTVEGFLAKYKGGQFKCTSYFDHKHLGNIPEVCDGRFFTYKQAIDSIMPAQRPFIERAAELLRRDSYANL